MSNAEDKFGRRFSAETQTNADTEKIWREEGSVNIYGLPLPNIENSLRVGTKVGKIGSVREKS